MTLAEPTFSYVRDLVKAEAAITLGDDKAYLVQSRLMPLARESGFSDVASFVAEVRRATDPTLRRRVVEAMTTNETSFFRDHEPFRAMTATLLPELARRRHSEHRVTIWSAACSTGQEPYSLAMSIIDNPHAAQGRPTEILATDINEKVLQRAREGRFSQHEVNRGLPASALVRHFERSGPTWQISKTIRDMVVFRPMNLAQPFNVPQMDIVLMRNVLIYFDRETKIDILRRVRGALRPDGYLLLGGAETTLGIDDGFERTAVGATSVYRPAGATAADERAAQLAAPARPLTRHSAFDRPAFPLQVHAPAATTL